MADYKTLTNPETENQLERLKSEYEKKKKTAIENYRLMLELAQYYGEVNDILETRTGKKKEG